MNRESDQLIGWLFLAAVIGVIWHLKRPRLGPSGAFGTAQWMSQKAMRAAGFLSGKGLIIGRTWRGALIRVPQYVHVLLTGITGGGKGVSVILPNLLDYRRGAIICFDPMLDLHATVAARRAALGDRIIRLAPFDGGVDAFNPLDTITAGSPILVETARALSAAIVVRLGTEPDPHWCDRAEQVIFAVLVLVLLRFQGRERSLSSVQEIISDPELLAGAAAKLIEIDGIPGRLGRQVKSLFENGKQLSREGSGIVSTALRMGSFADSELVARAIDHSTFDPKDLKPGTLLFIQISAAMMAGYSGLCRFWLTGLLKAIGPRNEAETLVVIDEASVVNGLGVVEEALVRGRAAGLRLLLAYQSDAQVKAAFKDKPTLVYDNCSVQLYLGAASIEGAERISKSLGDYTQVVQSVGTNESRSHGGGSVTEQFSRGGNQNASYTGRPLLRSEEVLQLNSGALIAFVRGHKPILAKRVKWYEAPEFNGKPAKKSAFKVVWWWLLVAAAGCIVWKFLN